jgi:hypothetical protein
VEVAGEVGAASDSQRAGQKKGKRKQKMAHQTYGSPSVCVKQSA